MEPQVEIYCKKENKKKDCSCLWIVLAIILLALAFFIGALVESLATIVTALGLGAVIVLIIALAILLIISIINLICCKKNNSKKCCY